MVYHVASALLTQAATYAVMVEAGWLLGELCLLLLLHRFTKSPSVRTAAAAAAYSRLISTAWGPAK